MKPHQVSLGIGIKFTDLKGFSEAIAGWNPKYEVKKPRTINQIIRDKKAYTRGIRDCCAGGIITKSKEIVAFHLDPGNDMNRQFDVVKDSILKKLDKDEPYTPFLVGSKNLVSGTKSARIVKLKYYEVEEMIKQGQEMFAKMEEFFSQFKLPVLKIKGIPLLDDIGASFACNPEQNRLFVYVNSIGNVKSKSDLYKIPASVDEFVKSEADEIIFD